MNGRKTERTTDEIIAIDPAVGAQAQSPTRGSESSTFTSRSADALTIPARPPDALEYGWAHRLAQLLALTWAVELDSLDLVEAEQLIERHLQSAAAAVSRLPPAPAPAWQPMEPDK